MKFISSSLLAAAALMALAGTARAQLIDSYNANSLSSGSISSWSPIVGTDVASTSNFVGLLNPTVRNTDPIFNGNNYVSFGVDAGLATTGPIVSGSANRTVAAVYATTSATTATAAIAGMAGVGVAGQWFILQSRNNAVIGDPYLAGFADDLSNGQAPAAERLTFALATYDGTTATLYWAYGTGGAINYVSAPLSLNTAGQFDMGFDPGENSPGQLELGSVQVYNTSMVYSADNGAEAFATIHALQLEYSAVPEPSTYALMLGGLALLGFCVRRKLA